jgi:hypothetical protein
VARKIHGDRDITWHKVFFFQFGQVRRNLLTIFGGQERFEGHRFIRVGLMNLVDDGAIPQGGVVDRLVLLRVLICNGDDDFALRSPGPE